MQYNQTPQYVVRATVNPERNVETISKSPVSCLKSLKKYILNRVGTLISSLESLPADTVQIYARLSQSFHRYTILSETVIN